MRCSACGGWTGEYGENPDCTCDGPHWLACHYVGVARSLDSEATILARRGQWARAIETRTDRDLAWCRALDGLVALLKEPT